MLSVHQLIDARTSIDERAYINWYTRVHQLMNAQDERTTQLKQTYILIVLLFYAADTTDKN